MSVIRKISLFFAIIIAIMAALWISLSYYQFKNTPLLINTQQSVVIRLLPGKGTHYLIHVLHKKHLLNHRWTWKTFALIRTLSHPLKAGEYEIQQGMTFEHLLNRIIAGQVRMREFTIIEGWTYEKLRNALEKNNNLKHVLETMSETQLLKVLGSDHLKAEGLFYPDTYFYTWGETDLSILQQAFLKMQQVLQHYWCERAQGLVYQNAYEAFIVGSLIEKETAISAEKPFIAGVVMNRLKKRMRLQIDPAVAYGLKKQPGQRLSHLDLKIPTSYNTYIHFGLPPTPIALPSVSSIYAALHPAITNFLFYVSGGGEKHIFSATYESHLRAVKAYRMKKMDEVKVSDHDT